MTSIDHKVQPQQESDQDLVMIEVWEDHQYQGNWNDPGGSMVPKWVPKDSPEAKAYQDRLDAAACQKSNERFQNWIVILGLCAAIGGGAFTSCSASYSAAKDRLFQKIVEYQGHH